MMRRVLLAVLAVWCVGSLGAEPINPTAATVNLAGTVGKISVSDLNKRISYYQELWASQGQPFADSDRADVLQELIDRMLFRQAAERDNIRMTVETTQKLVEQARQVLGSSLGRQATDADLRSVASQQGLTWDQWVEQLKDTAMPQLYVTQTRAAVLQNVAQPTEAEIRHAYRTYVRTVALVPDIIEWSHVFVKSSRAKIDEANSKRQSGTSFEALVPDYSEDEATKKLGGYMSYIQVDTTDTRTKYGAEFVDALFDLEEGQVSGVLQSARGFHIVKVIRKYPAKLYGLDDTTPPGFTVTPRAAIRNQLLASKQNEALAAETTKVVSELRGKAKIQVLAANIGFTIPGGHLLQSHISR